MVLTGTFSRSLDDKRRLSVPKRLREEFCTEKLTHLYIAPGRDGSLELYSPASFEQYAAELSQSTSNSGDVRTYRRLFFSSAERVDVDGQGRIRIPDRLAEFAGLAREIVLIGVQDHAELWDAIRWQSYVDQNNTDFDEVASRALEHDSAGLPGLADTGQARTRSPR